MNLSRDYLWPVINSIHNPVMQTHALLDTGYTHLSLGLYSGVLDLSISLLENKPDIYHPESSWILSVTWSRYLYGFHCIIMSSLDAIPGMNWISPWIVLDTLIVLNWMLSVLNWMLLWVWTGYHHGLYWMPSVLNWMLFWVWTGYHHGLYWMLSWV